MRGKGKRQGPHNEHSSSLEVPITKLTHLIHSVAPKHTVQTLEIAVHTGDRTEKSIIPLHQLTKTVLMGVLGDCF